MADLDKLRRQAAAASEALDRIGKSDAHRRASQAVERLRSLNLRDKSFRVIRTEEEPHG